MCSTSPPSAEVPTSARRRRSTPQPRSWSVRSPDRPEPPPTPGHLRRNHQCRGEPADTIPPPTAMLSRWSGMAGSGAARARLWTMPAERAPSARRRARPVRPGSQACRSWRHPGSVYRTGRDRQHPCRRSAAQYPLHGGSPPCGRARLYRRGRRRGLPPARRRDAAASLDAPIVTNGSTGRESRRTRRGDPPSRFPRCAAPRGRFPAPPNGKPRRSCPARQAYRSPFPLGVGASVPKPGNQPLTLPRSFARSDTDRGAPVLSAGTMQHQRSAGGSRHPFLPGRRSTLGADATGRFAVRAAQT